VTLCHYGSYKRDHYLNNTFVKTAEVLIRTDNVSRIKNFINETYFYSKDTNKNLNVREHTDYFKIPEMYDCVRFNGVVTNKSIELFKANTTLDLYHILLKNSYQEYISMNEYYNYSISFKNTRYPNVFHVYIIDNRLNSFESHESLKPELNKEHVIEIEKTSIEEKLSEPYNQCRDRPSINGSYHQWNCLEACTYREIKNKYNCSVARGLFAIPGFKQCNIGQTMNILQKEFLTGCKEECPKSCYTEKFDQYISTTQITGNYDTVHTTLKFFFRDMSTLNITQIPKTDTFTFLNNIGGGLGLFMGIAFPNLIEFIQFVFEIFKIIFS